MAAATVTHLGDGLHRVADGLVNWYVVVEGDAVAIYDAGWPRSWPRVQAALAELRIDPSAVVAVVLTHGHPDHLGAAADIRKATGAAIHVHDPEIARIGGESKGASPYALVPGLLPHMWRPSATGFVLHAAARGFMNPTWVTGARPFVAGESLDVPGRPVVVATPGHTEGHVALTLPDRGMAFVGDSIATLDVLTRRRGPQVMPDALNSDPERTRESLAEVAGLAATLLLPGHGEPFSGNPTDAVERALDVDGEPPGRIPIPIAPRV